MTKDTAHLSRNFAGNAGLFSICTSLQHKGHIPYNKKSVPQMEILPALPALWLGHPVLEWVSRLPQASKMACIFYFFRYFRGCFMAKSVIYKRARRVPLPLVFSSLGLILSSSGMLLCPFHAEGTPSMRYYADSNRVHCFGCGENVDGIALVSRLKGLTLLQAAQYIIKLLSSDAELLPDSSPAPGALDTDILPDFYSDIYIYIYKEISLSSRGLQYLLSERGLSRNTVDTVLQHTRCLEPGTSDEIYSGKDPRSVILNGLRQRFSDGELKAAGVLNRKRNLVFTGDSVLFFHYDSASDRFISISSRNLWVHAPKSTKLHRTPFQPWCSWTYPDRSPQKVYVIESILDAASFSELFKTDHSSEALYSVCGIPSQKRIQTLQDKFPGSEIIVAFDGDSAGIAGAEKLQGVSIVTFRKVAQAYDAPENIKDYNELLCYIKNKKKGENHE